MEIILDKNQIARQLDSIAQQIINDLPQGASMAIVGIRSRGETLGRRLHKKLQHLCPKIVIDYGTLDITLYRDDLNQMGAQQPTVRATEIDFDIDDRLIVMVDDVLNTGRTVRAALDALVDLGRPHAIRLAVLIDRGHRELPICPDYTGKALDAPSDKRVHVYLHEVDEKEVVVVE
ncbi:MAG: bifunctional pyr operon transcriptional regulator/uracil phosphoribosyltransferase PyrR [Planctomycetes bacterium]|nr:bifunctional pyr operon transcriptional regulator/uracil phosphoribosyltransferase PyrR [Planctomycetota bacterium]